MGLFDLCENTNSCCCLICSLEVFQKNGKKKKNYLFTFAWKNNYFLNEFLGTEMCFQFQQRKVSVEIATVPLFSLSLLRMSCT